MIVNREDYEVLGECIVTAQVQAALVAGYFDDAKFKKWYMKRYGHKSKSKKGGQY